MERDSLLLRLVLFAPHPSDEAFSVSARAVCKTWWRLLRPRFAYDIYRSCDGIVYDACTDLFVHATSYSAYADATAGSTQFGKIRGSWQRAGRAMQLCADARAVLLDNNARADELISRIRFVSLQGFAAMAGQRALQVGASRSLHAANVSVTTGFTKRAEALYTEADLLRRRARAAEATIRDYDALEESLTRELLDEKI